ncbi:hypothetical protein K9L97_01385 [Candidatus Woesearchaeota archaeon]|nr:hypothetical protein [Candidatus Woesearchaeota archaeon]
MQKKISGHYFLTRIYNHIFQEFISKYDDSKVVGYTHSTTKEFDTKSYGKYYFLTQKIIDYRNNILNMESISEENIVLVLKYIISLYFEHDRPFDLEKPLKELLSYSNQEFNVDLYDFFEQENLIYERELQRRLEEKRLREEREKPFFKKLGSKISSLFKKEKR